MTPRPRVHRADFSSEPVQIITEPGGGFAGALIMSTFGTAIGDWTELRQHFCDSLTTWADLAESLPELGATQVRRLAGRYSTSAVYQLAAKGGKAAALLEGDTDGWWRITTAGETAAAADAAMTALRALIPDYVYSWEPSQAEIQVTFWMAHPMQVAVSRRRPLPAMPWADVEGNYPDQIRAQLTELVERTAPPAGGNLLVFHGVPGTGKTRFLQSLATEWGPWCDVHFVVDPEEMFNTALYLHTVALGEYDTERWRLVVIEDGDEFIAADAKRRSGAAVSRLLNVADGFIGQGLRVMVLVSTNVEAVGFTEAIVRGGRCGALVEFPAFPAEEADAWVEANGGQPGQGERTLAQLFNPAAVG